MTQRKKQVTIEQDIYVRCSECGEDLECDFGMGELAVTQCEKCMDAATNEARKEGREEAEAAR